MSAPDPGHRARQAVAKLTPQFRIGDKVTVRDAGELGLLNVVKIAYPNGPKNPCVLASNDRGVIACEDLKGLSLVLRPQYRQPGPVQDLQYARDLFKND